MTTYSDFNGTTTSQKVHEVIFAARCLHCLEVLIVRCVNQKLFWIKREQKSLPKQSTRKITASYRLADMTTENKIEEFSSLEDLQKFFEDCISWDSICSMEIIENSAELNADREVDNDSETTQQETKGSSTKNS